MATGFNGNKFLTWFGVIVFCSSTIFFSGVLWNKADSTASSLNKLNEDNSKQHEIISNKIDGINNYLRDNKTTGDAVAKK